MSAPTTGRLTARPPTTGPGDLGHAPGVHALGIGGRRDGLLVVPERGGAPLPLVVALHGAGGTGRQMVDLLGPAASARGVALLAPDSRGRTWDVVLGGYGPDVAFLDQALAETFAAVPIEPDRLAVAGFSDGATYALSIGLTNGDLFGHVLAYSPGFLTPAAEIGRPRVFVSHGARDAVLPVDRCSRRIVPQLRTEGYDVAYEEFDGGHVVPTEAVEHSLDRFLGR